MLESLPGYDAWLEPPCEKERTMLMLLAPYEAQCRVLREKLKARKILNDMLFIYATGLDALGYPAWAAIWVPTILTACGVLEIDVTEEEQEDASR